MTESESLTLDRILRAKSFRELRPASEREVLDTWMRLGWERVNESSETILGEAPRTLDCVSVESGGITYRLYGVLHGWTGGPSHQYRDFVEKSLDDEKVVLFEKMLSSFYGQKGDVNIPDFWVLGRTGQFVLGFRTMAFFPFFLASAVREMFQEFVRREEPVPEDVRQAIDSVRYHSIDRELRRALGDSFPTRLQIDYEMSRWDGAERYLDLDLLLAVVPRSAYIAEFAKAYAKCRGLDTLAVVVGDRHLTEVEHFLRHPLNRDDIEKAARMHAERIAAWPPYYSFLFVRYLAMVLAGASLGFLPYLLIMSAFVL